MENIKRSNLVKIVSMILVIAFISLDLSYACPPEDKTRNFTLAAPSLLQQDPMTGQAARFQQSIFSEWRVLNTVLVVGKYLLEEKLPIKRLPGVILLELGAAAIDGIDLSGVTMKEGVVSIPCVVKGARSTAEIALKGSVSLQGLSGFEWLASDKYVLIELPEGYKRPEAPAVETKEAPEAAMSAPVAVVEAPELPKEANSPSSAPKNITIRAVITRMLLAAIGITALTPLVASAADGTAMWLSENSMSIAGIAAAFGAAIAEFFILRSLLFPVNKYLSKTYETEEEALEASERLLINLKARGINLHLRVEHIPGYNDIKQRITGFDKDYFKLVGFPPIPTYEDGYYVIKAEEVKQGPSEKRASSIALMSISSTAAMPGAAELASAFSWLKDPDSAYQVIVGLAAIVVSVVVLFVSFYIPAGRLAKRIKRLSRSAHSQDLDELCRTVTEIKGLERALMWRLPEFADKQREIYNGIKNTALDNIRKAAELLDFKGLLILIRYQELPEVAGITRNLVVTTDKKLEAAVDFARWALTLESLYTQRLPIGKQQRAAREAGESGIIFTDRVTRTFYPFKSKPWALKRLLEFINSPEDALAMKGLIMRLREEKTVIIHDSFGNERNVGTHDYSKIIELAKNPGELRILLGSKPSPRDGSSVTLNSLDPLMIGIGAAGIVAAFFAFWRIFFPLSWHIRRLHSEDYRVCCAAKDALAKMGSPAVPYLEKALRDTRYYVRSAAAETLRNIKDPGVAKLLVGALSDSEFSVSSAAADGLESIGWTPATLEEKIPYFVVRRRWDDLVDIGAPAVPALIKVVHGRDWVAANMAADSLARIGRPAIPALLEGLMEGSYNGELCVRSLLQISCPELSFMREYLETKHLLTAPLTREEVDYILACLKTGKKIEAEFMPHRSHLESFTDDDEKGFPVTRSFEITDSWARLVIKMDEAPAQTGPGQAAIPSEKLIDRTDAKRAEIRVADDAIEIVQTEPGHDSLAATAEKPGSDAMSATQFFSDQSEADGGVVSLIALARRARRENQKLIIGLETDWIPGIGVKGSLQQGAISALIEEVDDIGKTLRSMGLDNVEIVHANADQLALSLTKAAEKSSTEMRNIVVMASAGTIESPSFSDIRNAPQENRPFLACTDPEDLIKLYEEFGETIAKQLHIKLMSWLYMTLKAATGNEPPEAPWIRYDKAARRLFLKPTAEPIDYETLKREYAAEVTALASA